MPTVILLDVSLSMLRPIQISDSIETNRKQLAILGIRTFLDHLHLQSKLEFTTLVTFSSHYKDRWPFTRDYNILKSDLNSIEDCDKTCIENALQGVNQMVLCEWGNSIPCQIIVVTDGNPGIGNGSLKELLSRAHQPNFPLPFSFPAKLHIVCIAPPNDPHLLRSRPLYQRLVDCGRFGGSVIAPEKQLTDLSVASLFQKLVEEIYVSYNGILKCGHLESKIYLSPSPVPYIKQTDFSTETYTISDTIEVCGFIDVADVGSPMAISRHLMLPSAMHHSSAANGASGSGKSGKESSSSTPVKSEGGRAVDIDLTVDDDGTEDCVTPSFCVLLHGALKVENAAALVLIANNWYGFIYSWADSKKKSNLMLTVLVPGSGCVPWLGDLNYLHCDEGIAPENIVKFPLKPTEKRSYSQNSVVWIRQAGLQSDIQKILRHARKLPEKTQQFYKELNRLRKAAVQLGFLDLLTSLAYIFDNECTQLPGNTHPDCALQLSHAADILRKTQLKDIKHVITPLPTTYST